MPEELVFDHPAGDLNLSPVPPEFDGVYAQAEQARAENDLPRAHELFVRATELDPNHAGAWAGRAASTADLDEAITGWANSLALAPGNADARAALDACVAGKIVGSTKGDAPSLITLGRMLARLGHKAQAQRMFQGATELDAGNADAWIWRAGVTENVEQMIGYLKLALVHDPNNAQAKAGLKWASSLTVPPTLPGPDSEETARLIEEAERALAAKDRVRAHNLFEQATERDPKNEEAWLWRGSTTPNVDEALMSIERALAINPDNRSAREAQSWLRARRLHRGAVGGQALAPAPSQPTRSQRIFRLLVPALILIGLLALIALYVVARR